MPRSLLHPIALLPALASLAGSAHADLQPSWLTRLPVGTSLSSGLQGMVVSPAGTTYVCATAGPSSNTDVLTAAIAPDGSILWSRTYNGPQDWHDQARGIALGANGSLYVVGNTPNAGLYAKALLLEYDAASGNLLRALQYSSGAFVSEHGSSVVADSAGNVYIAGGTVGDGADALLLKYNATGTLQWSRKWDGPASGPFSQDQGLEILLDPDENPVVLIHGIMASLHADYVVMKLSPLDGSSLWTTTWGGNGEDAAVDMELDASGDVLVTGTALNVSNTFGTIRLRGSDGQLLWQSYDQLDLRNSARALTLDGQGGVYITGSIDPNGDQSFQAKDIWVVKRDAATGALLWTFRYGSNCQYCLDLPADVQVDPYGNVFVTGSTNSPPYQADRIMLVLDASGGLETERSILSGSATETASGGILRFDAAYNLYDGGRFYGADDGQIDVAVARFERLGSTWSNYCPTSPNSLGAGALIDASGSSSVAVNDFRLTVLGAAATQFGLFFYGPNQTQQPFGNGFRCVGGGTFRLLPAILTDPSGAAQRTLDFTAPPASTGPGAILPGSQWNFQFWYRDPLAGGATFNLSNALTVFFQP